MNPLAKIFPEGLFGTMRFLLLMLIGSTFLFAGCTTPGESELTNETLTIRGSVSYRERIALTPDSVVVVELNEVSSKGEFRESVSQLRIENPGQVPIPFEIQISAGDVRAYKYYGVTARIEHAGRVLFDQSEPNPVLTHGYSTFASLTLSKTEVD